MISTSLLATPAIKPAREPAAAAEAIAAPSLKTEVTVSFSDAMRARVAVEQRARPGAATEPADSAGPAPALLDEPPAQLSGQAQWPSLWSGHPSGHAMQGSAVPRTAAETLTPVHDDAMQDESAAHVATGPQLPIPSQAATDPKAALGASAPRLAPTTPAPTPVGVNSATKPARVISVTTPARSAAAPAVANLPTESRQGAALTIVAATPTDVHAQSDLKAKSDSSAPMTHLSQWLHVPAANTLAALPPNAAPAAGTPVETSSMAAPSGTAAVASGVTSTPISAVAIPTARAQLPRSNKPIKISAAAASATEQPAAVTRVTDQPAPVPVAARPDPAASAPAHDAAPASDATAVPPLVVSQPGTLAANSAAGDDGAADDDSATNAGVSAVTTPTLSGTARIAMLTPQTVVAPVEAQAGRGDAAIGAVPAMPVANAAPTHAAAAAAPTEQVRPTLVQVLGERLQLEITKGSQNAVIRLDPASMGSIEISIRHDAGALQVHLSASNPAVLTQLQGIGDALRQDLSQRHQGQVSVQVSAQTAAASRDANGRPRQGQDTGEDAGPTRALSEADDGEAAGAIDWRSLRSSGA